MNKETYNKAIAINNRLSKLQKVKEALTDDNYKLTYSLGSTCADWMQKYISAIIDKHDKMIKQEIDDDIAALNKEIEVL